MEYVPFWHGLQVVGEDRYQPAGHDGALNESSASHHCQVPASDVTDQYNAETVFVKLIVFVVSEVEYVPVENTVTNPDPDVLLA